MIVSIVTPTLNASTYLQKCITSVRENETSDVEIEHIIVDGGSTDGTVELARSYGLRIITGADTGIFDAINKGSFASKGELIGCLGGDDTMLPGGIAAVVDAYRRTGRAWLVGGVRWIDDHSSSLGTLSPPPLWMSGRGLACLGWNPIMHAGTFFSRSLFHDLNGFKTSYRVSGDYDLFVRARLVSPYARVKQLVGCFRRTGVNFSLVHRDRMQRENQSILDQFGPKSEIEQRVWRSAIKIWLNFGNPAWMAGKIRRRPLNVLSPAN